MILTTRQPRAVGHNRFALNNKADQSLRMSHVDAAVQAPSHLCAKRRSQYDKAASHLQTNRLIVFKRFAVTRVLSRAGEVSLRTWSNRVATDATVSTIAQNGVVAKSIDGTIRTGKRHAVAGIAVDQVLVKGNAADACIARIA